MSVHRVELQNNHKVYSKTGKKLHEKHILENPSLAPMHNSIHGSLHTFMAQLDSGQNLGWLGSYLGKKESNMGRQFQSRSNQFDPVWMDSYLVGPIRASSSHIKLVRLVEADP